jgi:hypothetical protein
MLQEDAHEKNEDNELRTNTRGHSKASTKRRKGYASKQAQQN